MTGFNFNTAAPTNTQTIDKQHIDSGDFWPVIDLDELRRDMRIDTTITPDRLFDTAVNSVAYVNDQLKDIIAIVPLAQHISQTDPRRINGEPLANIRYRRAVYSYTKALLLEIYNDYDSTGKTAARSDAKQETAEDYRREGHHAIAELLKKPRIDCELI